MLGSTNFRRHLIRFGALISILIVPLFSAEAAGISGEIKVKGKRPPQNLVVYLTQDPMPDAAAAKQVTVSQRNAVFSPSRIVVIRGGSVKFVNDEEKNIDHNVYSLSKKNKFDIGLATQG